MDVKFTKKFRKSVKKIKDQKFRNHLKKEILKIIDNPETVGKPLRYNLKGERSVRIKPYRIFYKVEKKVINMLRIKHRKKAYK